MRSLSRSETIGVFTLLSIITFLVGWTSLRGSYSHVAPGIAIRPSAKLPVETASTANINLTETAPSEIVVHVAGAVRNPGVYHLRPGARNDDAISAAGGALPTANTDAINLAAHIEDGTQLFLPTRTEHPDGGAADPIPSVTPGKHTVPSSSKAQKNSQSGMRSKPDKLTSASQGQVNLNSAGAAELQKLPGIGPSMAQRIIEFRKENGGFKSAEDLMQVSGIGEKRFEKMRALVKLK